MSNKNAIKINNQSPRRHEAKITKLRWEIDDLTSEWYWKSTENKFEKFTDSLEKQKLPRLAQEETEKFVYAFNK